MKSVPFDTPARAATSSTRVPAKPFSTNSASAASSNSPGRASLRRLRRWRGSASSEASWGVCGGRVAMAQLMTERLLIYSMPCRSTDAAHENPVRGLGATPESPSTQLDTDLLDALTVHAAHTDLGVTKLCAVALHGRTVEFLPKPAAHGLL